jgi:selenide,water dikinase
MGPGALAQVLRPLQNIFQNADFPDLLVGLNSGDDAAVYKITDDTAIIQTIDFFTPIVDDPYQFGAIAAANAMSDVYAMGGEVILALNICGFPAGLPLQMISEILRGGAEKIAEAGAALAGGHTIIDKEPKYGLSVLGRVHPEELLTKGGAQVGDMLVLTKPLGVGLITTALKKGAADASHVKKAVKSMMMLNKDASRIIRKTDVSACTDITGFSLLGHGLEMAQQSGVRLQLSFNQLPFIDGALDYAEKRFFPGGACNNEHYYKEHIDFDPSLSEEKRMALFTPETSGGLLAAVSKDGLEYLENLFNRKRHPFRIIGEVTAGQGIEVTK